MYRRGTSRCASWCHHLLAIVELVHTGEPAKHQSGGVQLRNMCVYFGLQSSEPISFAKKCSFQAAVAATDTNPKSHSQWNALSTLPSSFEQVLNLSFLELKPIILPRIVTYQS